jgi:hypothetical protein
MLIGGAIAGKTLMKIHKELVVELLGSVRDKKQPVIHNVHCGCDCNCEREDAAQYK